MKKFIYGVLAFVPALAFAQNSSFDLTNLSNLIESVGNIIASIIPIMFALAIVYFFWGLVTYIRSAGDPKAADSGKSIMIYGVIAIAVMVSIYGLVNWLQDSIGLDSSATVNLPTVTISVP